MPVDGAEVDLGTVRVEGWALDQKAPLRRAMVVTDEDSGTRAVLGIRRPDVAEAFPDISHALRCGVRCDLDLRSATSGRVSLWLLVQDRDAAWHEAASTTVNLAGRPAPGGKRARAAFTIVKDEAVMLPLWLEYYSRHFAAEDLYVLDHDSTDGSTAAAGSCRVVPVHREQAHDHRWLRATVEAFQAFLLRSYETVLFAEVDEFVVPDPSAYRDLADYIDRLQGPAARCTGFDVIQQSDEPALRFDLPVLAQRRVWHPSSSYNKRLLARVPLRWTEGFHDELNAPDDPPDPHLMLVHLHRVDYDCCFTRHRASAARSWSEGDLARGDGAHNRIADPKEFERWFRGGSGLDAQPEPIPEHVRAVL